MAQYPNKQIILAARTDGLPRADHFATRSAVLKGCDSGMVIVRNHYLSVDPAQKGWMSTAVNYASATVGEPMKALAVGEIVESRLEDFRVGEFVTGWFGWQDYAHVGLDSIQRKVDPTLAPIRYAVSILGLNGLTAWIVIQDLLQLQPGQTCLISTAAGAVGSIAGQLARQRGCHVIGLTGSDEKVAICEREFGYHAAINYKEEGWLQALQRACPQGVDRYFDMAGGWISDAVIQLMNQKGFHAQVGTAAVAAWDPVPSGPRRERIILVKELTQKGFVIFNHVSRFEEAIRELVQLLDSEGLCFREDIRDGLDAGPQALVDLYSGSNTGKALIRLAGK